MIEKPQPETAPASEQPLTLSEFFESVPPNTPKGLPSLYEVTRRNRTGIAGGVFYSFSFKLPEILIHCANEICNGPRVYRPTKDSNVEAYSGVKYSFFEYLCSNCRSSLKTFAVRMLANDGEPNAVITKLGEFPPYGPITPTRLLKLLGDQRETFLSGRRCENQGLGIGAFSYYRRVVEHQKDRIIDEPPPN